MVTERIKPLRFDGREIHQIGLPYHWGYAGASKGDSANDLFSIVLDPNVHIQEVKAASADILPGRRPRGAGAAGVRRRPPCPGARAGGRLQMSPATVLETPAWPDSYDGEAKPRVGFFTDTSVCIGCKACEVACKEWNQVPEDPNGFTGTSYDNSAELGANRWRHVAFIEQRVEVDGVASSAPDSWVKEAQRQQLVEQGVESAGGRPGLPLADELRRLQALHGGRLPRRLPDGIDLPHRVRDRGGAGGHLQRLRLLRRRLPLRRARPARGGRAGLEVHPLLRPPPGRHGARLRAGLPDGLDPVRRARRAARARVGAGGEAARARQRRGSALRHTTTTTASAASAPSSC